MYSCRALTDPRTADNFRAIEHYRGTMLRVNSLASPLLVALVGFAALGVSGCDGCGQGSIAEGRQAEIQLDPRTIVFDTIVIGTSQERWITVENTGQTELEILDQSWRGDSSEFTTQGLRGLAVAAGATATFSIVYTPANPELDDATLIIDSNAGDEPRVFVDVLSQGQSSRLFAEPNPVNFTAERLNEPVLADVTLFNLGSRPFTIDSMRMATGLGHFALVDPPELPANIGPDDELVLQVAYEPATGGSHADRLLIGCDADNCEEGRFLVDLSGTSLSPYLVLSPGEVGFGAIPIGDTVTAVVTARNDGQADAVIDSLTIAPNPVDGDDEIRIVSIDGADYDGLGDLVLGPDESAEIVVSYSPVDNADDIETFVARSNDPELPIQSVRLAGRAASSRLEVFPLLVDFGAAAPGFSTVDKEVVIRNAGTDLLDMSPLTYRADGEGAITMLNLDLMPAELAPDETFTLRMRFDPPRLDDTSVDSYFGSLIVNPLNDPATTEVIVQLQAFRADSPECELLLIGPSINFGTVPRGTRAEGTTLLRNRGSGPCEVVSAALERSIFDIVFSNYFDFVSLEPAAPFTLGPGDEATLTASYFPRALTPLSETFGDRGSIELRVQDPFADVREVSCGTGGSIGGRACGVDLNGRSAIAELSVIPGNLDVGLVTLGCNSQTQALRVYNTGSAEVQVTAIGLEGCTEEFSLSGLPRLPAALVRGEFLQFDLTYAPIDLGEDRCRIVVEGTSEGGGRIVVPIRGEGVDFSRTVDRFEQVSGRSVDVLFVVDNSGSMGEEQSNLARNFDAFIRSADAWESDFQIGVVTTQIDGDVRDPSEGGSRAPGELLGGIRIITPATPSYASVFSENARVGTGDPGTAESGLESARIALTDPVITDLDAPCDEECVEPYSCVSHPTLGSACGGYNRGFLREDASLEIVFVSDEEDQSRADLTFFIDFFSSIKGVLNDTLFHASAIVGPPGGCSSAAGDAVEGERYIGVSDATGGETASICDSEFSTVLESIGERAFGLRRQFFLSRVADPATVEMYDLASCAGSSRTPRTTGWIYDRDANAVVFDEGAEPPADDCFEVEYEAACF